MSKIKPHLNLNGRHWKKHSHDVVSHGYGIVPIKQGAKRPYIKKWQSEWTGSVDDIDPKFDKYGIGIVTGTGETPVYAVDVDTPDPDVAEKFGKWITDKFPDALVRTGKAPKMLYLFKGEQSGITKSISRWFHDSMGDKHRLEILGKGQQFVAFHIHPETEREYEWDMLNGDPASISATDLPVLTTGNIQEIIEKFEELCLEECLTPSGRSSLGHEADDNDGDDMLMASPPVEIKEESDLWDDLNCLDPNEYETWMMVGMALHHQFSFPEGGEDPAEYLSRGFEMWNEWSSEVDNYAGSEDLRSRWRDFKVGRSNGVTFRSVQARANEVRKENVTYSDVINCNPKNDVKLIDAYREREREYFNKKYALVMIEGKAVIVYRETNANTGYIETKYTNAESLRQVYKNKKMPVTTKGKNGEVIINWNSAFNDWLERYDRKTYKQAAMQPSAKIAASKNMPESGDVYNLYIGAQFKSVKGNCSQILNHIKNTWCSGDDELHQYVIKWLARLVLEPGKPGSVVLVLRSGQGTGKNIILDIVSEYFGSNAIMLAKPEDLAGFNDHLATSVFVFLNEATWGGNKQLDGSIKTTITDSMLMVERKFVPKFQTRNYTHVVVCTNSDWAIPVGIDDRRIVMIDVDEAKVDDFRYFDSLVAEIENGGKEAFIHHLMNEVDISTFDVRKLPNTESKTKLDHKIRSMTPIDSWWLEVLTDGGFNFKDSGRVRFEEWTDHGSISKDLFHESYANHCRSERVESRNVVTKRINELLSLHKLQHTRPRKGGNRPWCFKLPSLSDARGAMEKKLKQHGPWQDTVIIDDDFDDFLDV